MADESTRDILRNTRKRRDENAKKEENRGDKAGALRPAEDKASGKRPMAKDKATGKRPATEVPDAPAVKRSGKLSIKEPSELGSKNKVADKTPVKEAAQEVREDSPSAQKIEMRFQSYYPHLNPELAKRSALEDQELVRLIARDSIIPRDYKELKKLSVEDSLATMVNLTYHGMVRSYVALKEYQSKTCVPDMVDSLIAKACATTDKEVKAREAAEERLQFVKERTTQGMANLQKKTSELEGLKEKNAQLAKEVELKQAELADQCSMTSDLEKLLQEEQARNGELQASLKARFKEEELMKAKAIKAHKRSAEYKDELGVMLLEAYDEAFEDCKKKIA